MFLAVVLARQLDLGGPVVGEIIFFGVEVLRVDYRKFSNSSSYPYRMFSSADAFSAKVFTA